uniref:Uncharacterized protein n=1 Tax=Oryza rufipogon TaxID=4529 RepID=A0A0E0QJ65_ORYRU
MASIHGKEGGNVASATEQREKARVVGDAEAKILLLHLIRDVNFDVVAFNPCRWKNNFDVVAFDLWRWKKQ